MLTTIFFERGKKKRPLGVTVSYFSLQLFLNIKSQHDSRRMRGMPRLSFSTAMNLVQTLSHPSNKWQPSLNYYGSGLLLFYAHLA